MELGKILIFGGTGFIGKHLIKSLNEKGYDYNCFDGDILNIDDVYAFIGSIPGEKIIIHLAGVFSGDIDNLIKVNTLGTINILEAASQYNAKKIIFSSTGAIYGEPTGISYEHDMPSPNTTYGLSKKLAEDSIIFYTQHRSLPSIILRFPNVYGDGGKGVIQTFIEAIKNTGKIKVHGNGEQERHFLHVEDAVESIALAIEHQESDIFNITNPIAYSIKTLISELEKIYTFEVEYTESVGNGLQRLLLSDKKAMERLKFKAKNKSLIL